LFDLIDVDLAKVRADRAAWAAERDPAARALLVHRLVVTAAHALLITRGVEAAVEPEVLDLFERHFLDTGIVADRFRPLIAAARQGAVTLAVLGDQALAFAQEIEDLTSMDDTLQFHPRVPPATAGNETRECLKVDLVKDLRRGLPDELVKPDGLVATAGRAGSSGAVGRGSRWKTSRARWKRRDTAFSNRPGRPIIGR
jgi:hypothetical protein